jgi:hypothetical protein
LVQFGRLMLVPRGLLLQHVKCMEYLFCIQSLLFSRTVYTAVHQLRELVVGHHILFAALYPSCVRPKLHYLHHVVDCIEAQGKHISCFSTERKHKMPKAVAAFAFRNFAVSLMVRCTLAEMELLMDPASVSEYALLGKVKTKGTFHFSTSMRTPFGVLSKNEFALVDSMGVIFVHFGLSLTPAAADLAKPPDFFAVVKKCAFVSPGRWREDGGELSRMPFPMSVTVCNSMLDGSDFLPVLPARV